MITNNTTIYYELGDEQYQWWVLSYGKRYGDKWLKEYLLTPEGVAEMQELLRDNSIDDAFSLLYQGVYTTHYAEFKKLMEKKEKDMWEKIQAIDGD